MIANTGMLRAAIAAAAWSWVEKMLQLAQRTSAPSSISVSISTAVWIVMCSEPVIRAPFERLRRAEFLAQRHQAGHLGLGDLDFLAAEVGKAEVLYDIVVKTGVSLRRHVENLQRNDVRRVSASVAPAVSPERSERQI